MTCPDGGLGNSCGGGYGNYVILQHSDGNFTLYGHMYANTITVKAGDTVKQGQVIGKMGTSGDSSGPHLHFEVRVGANDPSKKVDPLEYISKENTRSSSSLQALHDFISGMEGGVEQGDYYVAMVGEEDARITIGPGVVWEFDKEYFEKYGITSMEPGQLVKKDIVIKIKEELITRDLDEVRSSLAEDGIALKDYQVLALVSRKYNTYISGFADSYKKFGGKYSLDEYKGRADGLWKDFMAWPITGEGNRDDAKSINLPGLGKRRVLEWILFTTGEYKTLEDITVDDVPLYDGIAWNEYNF